MKTNSKRHRDRRVPNWLLLWSAFLHPVKAAATAAATAAAAADEEDGWEDFTNNLGSDLAPIISLFGEQVTKQYLSESLDWLEAFIFAMAPLGIITGMVSAIRIAGDPILRSVIGRPKESKASVEIELLSSTSSDVCEMWNGQGIARIQGESFLGQFVYVEDNNPTPSSGQQRRRIYTFKQAVKEKLYTPITKDGSALGNISTELLAQEDEMPPNLTLNMSRKDIPRWQLWCIAVIGILTQSAVIAYAVLSQYSMKLEKEGEPVAEYAFPLLAAGTVLLCGGMFLCALVVIRATNITYWNPQVKGKVVFLQRSGHVVGDQIFGSFCRVLDAPSLLTSKREFGVNRRGQNDRVLVKISTCVSLVGFIVQFTGLRGMHASVILAQLAATGIMTGLRSWMRLQKRQQNEIPSSEDEPSGFSFPRIGSRPSGTHVDSTLDVKGHELDWLSLRLEGCEEWYLGGRPGKPILGLIHFALNSSASPAVRAVDNRQDFVSLTPTWKNDCKEMAISLKEASETLLNIVYDTCEINAEWYNLRALHLPIPVRSHKGLEEKYCYVTFERTRDEERKLWGPWTCQLDALEAILSLSVWSSRRRQHIWNSTEVEKSNEPVWYLGPQSQATEFIFQSWIHRSRTLVKHAPSRKQLDFVGLAPGDVTTGSASYYGVPYHGTCHMMCSRTIFAYLCNGICEAIKSVNGKTVRRVDDSQSEYPSTSSVAMVSKSDFCLVNSTLKQLAIAITGTKFCSVEEVYMSIIPLLAAQGKLPDATEAYKDAMESANKLMAWNDSACEELFWWIYKNAWSSAPDIAAQAANQLGSIFLHQTRKQIACNATDSWDPDRFDLILSHFKKLHEDSKSTSIPFRFISEWGSLLLYLAVLRQELEGIRLLVSLRVETRYAANKFGRTILQKAIETRNPDLVTILLNSDIPVNASAAIKHGRTALQLAAENGDLDFVEMLLKKGAEVNASPGLKYGLTALQAAAREGHLDVLQMLFEAGALINAPPADRSGRSALQAAAESGNLEVVTWLLERGADSSQSPSIKYGLTALQAAAKGGHVEVFNKLLDHGADLRGEISYKGGLTPLQAACAGGNLDMVRLLILLGANVNAKPATINGRTALQAAAEGGYLEVVQLLIEEGADIAAEISRSGGVTPLEAASTNGHLPVVELLIQVGDNVNSYGLPLNRAARNGHMDVVNLLLETGAAVDPPYPQVSALIPAVEKGHLEIVKLLLLFAPSPSETINRAVATGCNALQTACKNGHLEVVRFLIAKGADVEKAPYFYNGLTAVQASAAGGSLDCLSELWAAKAGWGGGIAKCGGRDAVQAACEAGHEHMVEYLLKHVPPTGPPAEEYGLTALQAACKSGNSKIVAMVMEAGAHVSSDRSSQRGGSMALDLACKNGYTDIVGMLLKDGADPLQAQLDFVMRQAGSSAPLVSAIKGGHLTILELLLDVVDWRRTTIELRRSMLVAAVQSGHLAILERIIQEASRYGMRTDLLELGGLSEAASSGHIDVVESMINLGYDVNQVALTISGTHSGTPLEWAAHNGHYHVSKFLLRHGASIGANPDPTQKPPPLSVLPDYTYPLIVQDARFGNVALRGALRAGHGELAILLENNGAVRPVAVHGALDKRLVVVFQQYHSPLLDNASLEYQQSAIAEEEHTSNIEVPPLGLEQVDSESTRVSELPQSGVWDEIERGSAGADGSSEPVVVMNVPQERPSWMSKRKWKNLQWEARKRSAVSTGDTRAELEDLHDGGRTVLEPEPEHSIKSSNEQGDGDSAGHSSRVHQPATDLEQSNIDGADPEIFEVKRIGFNLTFNDLFEKSDDPYDSTTFFSTNIANEARTWYDYLDSPTNKKELKSYDNSWHLFPRLLNSSGMTLSCNGKGFFGSGDRIRTCPGACEYLEICTCGLFQFIRCVAFTEGHKKKLRSLPDALKFLGRRFSENEWQNINPDDEEKLQGALSELQAILVEFTELPASEEGSAPFIYPQLLFSAADVAKKWKATLIKPSTTRWRFETIPWPVFPLCQGHGKWGHHPEYSPECYGSPIYEGYGSQPSLRICQCGLFKLLKSGGVNEDYGVALKEVLDFFDPDNECWEEENVDGDDDGVPAYAISNMVRMIYNVLDQFSLDWQDFGKVGVED